MFRSSVRGMTLVEVIVSFALGIIIVVTLLAAVTQSAVFSESIDISWKATYLAQRRIDMLKRLDFRYLSQAVESNVRINADGNIDPAGDYLRTTEVDEDYDGNAYLTKVKISVNRIKVNISGGSYDAQGKVIFLGNPIVMETLFVDMQ